jgi:hypothetical protein
MIVYIVLVDTLAVQLVWLASPRAGLRYSKSIIIFVFILLHFEWLSFG